jgi:hypothetical protein
MNLGAFGTFRLARFPFGTFLLVLSFRKIPFGTFLLVLSFRKSLLVLSFWYFL